jgi:F1F0 ATPase subunit 2
MAAAPLPLLAALLGGLAVGWAFFYGLHRTVQALPRTRRPGLLIGVSLLLRMGLLLAAAGLLLRAGGQWQHLLAAFIGVMFMRFVLLRLGRRRTESEDPWG